MKRRCVLIDLSNHPEAHPVRLPKSGPFELIFRRPDGSTMRLKWVSRLAAEKMIGEAGFTLERQP